MKHQQLMDEADKVERHAKDQLPTWSLLGQTDKYSAAMDRAANLRRAAVMRPADRREYMRARGIA